MEQIFKKISKNYCIQLCSDRGLIKSCMEIRYIVFCEEKGFEPTNNVGLETDFFDTCSVHFLVTDRQKNENIATFRVIISDVLPVDSILERYGIEKFNHRCVEISRIAILNKYRGRASDNLSKGLFHASFYAAFILNAETIYIEVESILFYGIKSAGIHVEQLSPYFEHNGKRAIFNIDVNKVLSANFIDKNQDEKALIYRDLCDYKTLSPSFKSDQLY